MICISSSAPGQEPETRLQLLEMGAGRFMQKPFSFVELRARCRALIAAEGRQGWFCARATWS